MRKEKDFLGIKEIDENALYGINALRAQENFPDNGIFHKEWFRAMGVVKQACYQTYQQYKDEMHIHYKNHYLTEKMLGDEIITAMEKAALEISQGKHFDNFIVPAVNGGAGTSINMNINEIITNRALKMLGKKCGEYEIIHPIEQANIFQSTNDVVPTALKIAVHELLAGLEEAVNAHRKMLEQQEDKYRNILRRGFTQLQEATPSSFGKLFSSYNDALSRDWWRISKCFERIKNVNLGGSAIGTGITVPRFFIMEVIKNLRNLTGRPLAHGENLVDTTANLDSLVEVHGIMKAHAVSLEKMCNDLRLLSSDLNPFKEMSLPSRQVGSSIMPGKVNPVILEFVISSVHKIYANDNLIASLSGQGMLELNAYLPVIGNALLESLKLLKGCNLTLSKNVWQEIKINEELSYELLLKSPSVVTVLIPYIGYRKATDLALYMKEKGVDIISANEELKLIKKDKIRKILTPSSLLQLGFTVKDIDDANS